MEPGKRYTKSTDPNDAVFDAGAEGVRPDFQIGKQPNDAQPTDLSGNNRYSGADMGLADSKHKSAKDKLSAAEDGASENAPDQQSKGLGSSKDKAAAAESRAGGFLNKVGGKKEGKSKGSKMSAKSFLKKRGALMLVTLLLGGGTAGIMSSQALAPFALMYRMKQEFNSMKISNNRRARFFFGKFQLDTKGKKTKTIFGNIKIPKSQAKQMKRFGIEELDLTIDGKKHRVLTFQESEGAKKEIILSNKDAKNEDLIKKLNEGNFDYKGKGTENAIEFSNKKIDINSGIKRALKTNKKFFAAYNFMSKPWAGHPGGWFDLPALKVLKRLKISRNKYKDYDNADSSKKRAEAFEEATSTKKNLGKEKADLNIREDGVDENGNPTPDNRANNDEINPDASRGEVEATMKAKATEAASSAGSLVCGVYMAASMINSIKYFKEMEQALSFTSSFLQAVEKNQVEEGQHSPMGEFMNKLTKEDKYGNSALSAEGIGSIMSGDPVNMKYSDDIIDYEGDEPKINEDDPKISVRDRQALSAEKFHMDNTLASMHKVFDKKKGLLGALGDIQFTIDNMNKCSYIRIAAGVANIALLLTGVGVVAKISKAAVMKYAFAASIAWLAAIAIPQVGKMIVRDLIKDLGPDLGNALAVGANLYMAKNHQYSGGSAGDKKHVMAFKREQAAVIAEDAAADRIMLSPFDTSSEHTFMGSLVYSLIPLSFTLNSLPSTLAKFNRVALKSLASLSPAASAFGETGLITQEGKCPTLEAVGVMADAYCAPYYMSDFSTIGTTASEYGNYMAAIGSSPGGDDHSDPEDLFQHVFELKPANFKCGDAPCSRSDTIDNVDLDENANPVINENLEIGGAGRSNLFAFKMLCGTRDSMLGTMDPKATSVLAQIVDTGNNLMDVAIENLPGLDDFLDILESEKTIEEKDWIGGQNCVASDKNLQWNKEFKYYQRYLEDQRLYANMGLIKQGADETAMQRYQEKHPLKGTQNSVIAKMSGLSDQQIEARIAFAEAITEIVQYQDEIIGREAFPKQAQRLPAAPLLSEISLKLLQRRSLAKIAGRMELPVKYEYSLI